MLEFALAFVWGIVLSAALAGWGTLVQWAVAYAYRTEAGYSRRQFSGRLRAGGNGWARAHARATFQFQDLLAALGNERRRVFDDGSRFVIDLDQKR